MKKITPLALRAYFVILFFFCFSSSAFAASITASASGDWNSTSTWTGGVVPANGDVVSITGVIVTVSSNAGTVNSIVVESSATTTGKLVVQSNGILTVSSAATSLTLKGGEVENAGIINLTTTSTNTNCIQYDNTGSGMLVTSGKYSGTGKLNLDCIASTGGAAIRFAQNNTESIFSVEGVIGLNIYKGRPLFNVVGKCIIDGTGTITAGTNVTPVDYALIILAANNAQITINTNVTLNTYVKNIATKRGAIFSGSFTGTSLTNKGTINIQGSGSNGIGSVVTSTFNLINEGNINISGAFTESAMGINSTNGVFQISNTGTISISGLPTGVKAIGTTAASYVKFNNNTNGVLDLNVSSTEAGTGANVKLTNNGGTLTGSCILAGTFEPSTGTISPGGNGIGMITIEKPTTFVLSGKCIMNVNGKTTAGTDYDQIVLVGSLDISAASLEVTTDGGYTPSANDNIPLFSTLSHTGNFTSVTLPASWSVDYTTSSSSVSLEYALPVSIKNAVSINNIYAGNNEIVIQNANNKKISVYSLDGKQIYSANRTSDKTVIAIEKGIYIVSIDNIRSKVYVR